jgi:hypothetical protein
VTNNAETDKDNRVEKSKGHDGVLGKERRMEVQRHNDTIPEPQILTVLGAQ